MLEFAIAAKRSLPSLANSGHVFVVLSDCSLQHPEHGNQQPDAEQMGFETTGQTHQREPGCKLTVSIVKLFNELFEKLVLFLALLLTLHCRHKNMQHAAHQKIG